jgi:hypothetical protein
MLTQPWGAGKLIASPRLLLNDIILAMRITARSSFRRAWLAQVCDDAAKDFGWVYAVAFAHLDEPGRQP